MKLVTCAVSGIAAADRNFFGCLVQNYLQNHEQIDLRIDWSGGDNGTKDVKVVVDCCEFVFPRIKAGIDAALQGTYLAGPVVEPKHHLNVANAA